ncbi:MAG: PAS domain S-box protein [Microcoleus sp. PH2017_10_PVI_O_A]|uniref:PAS domain S-box protein n=1 Tax=unclassified Microcoleus TaxID=2642155 RepID=UPI001DBA1AFE|nr:MULTISPECIES: PAS domain S-box protein [unclassified Microcoleus]TAE82325.1 MAG: PAS domain S-box protein [Oscillatoriales cyanobacterium]MCC3406846.1 PAS domain S-box protein [Microcoleus sp. PH2017_10_PVI_O_A]MCC3460983.1 PAS domain S-box protein [Microcoleus sp. PH2017_11_PCY_U_A]MCC3479503.1 PAS domain S-box protein [Microcoleus sp. PH2017_12_PCY_D_A]MCC3526790.1 PAS domain S-box protein [Microcoleus sp. PH2017_21_RUC_O_A]
MSRILLLIDRHQQDLPIAHLNTEHEAIVLDRTSEPNSEFPILQIGFDLCILDEANFERIGPMVETLKTAAEPIFLPFLLLIKSQTPTLSEQPFSLSAKQLEGRIDDLIVSPVDATQLHLRVENLLARRQLSLELHRLQQVIKERTFTENLSIDSLQTANENLQREIAKRAEVEAALAENSYLKSLMNAMPDIVCFKDGEGRWQEANQAILEVFELSADNYRGLTDSQLGELSSFYREALQACEVSDRAAWEKGTLARGEEMIPRSNGTLKIYDVIKVPVFHPDGRRKSMVILGRDISEYKQARDELVRLASIVESSDDGIIGKTLAGTIQSWNAGAEKIYGYCAQEIKGQSIEILAIPERPKEISQILENIRAGATIDHYETVHLRKDGEQIDVSLTISPIKDATGAVTGVSTIARDITDSKRVEKALEQLRHQTEMILFSAGEGICGLNKQGKVTFVNPAAVRMAECESKQLIDRPLYETINRSQGECSQAIEQISPATDINSGSQLATNSNAQATGKQPLRLSSQILATLEDGEVRRVTDEVFWRGDGSSFPVEYVVAPMRERGEIIGAVVTFKDITDRLAIERMKDEFISVVSHELRTPMTSIHGALGLLNSGLLEAHPQKAKRMLEIAIANTDRLVRLINDILDLERMESSYSTAIKQTCNIADLMLQAADEMQGMARQAGVTLSVRPVGAQLLAVPDRLIQALTNLLSNAIKFSPAGATIWLSGESIDNRDLAEKAGLNSVSSVPLLSQSPVANPHLRVSSSILIAVKDQGRGIPADKLEMVFERFQQVDASDCRQKEGTGLGLAICRSIVQQHGGRIWVESVLGEGSTFFLSLPVMGEGES